LSTTPSGKVLGVVMFTEVVELVFVEFTGFYGYVEFVSDVEFVIA
jgi:hypothetical protein